MKKLAILPVLLTSMASAASLNGFDIQGYGFIKASSMYADRALASYNNINLSAPTHAVAETRGIERTSRMSFQTAQSRLGMNLKKGDALSSKIEFDFIDFNKSSPTTQMLPRVRIASVTYAWDNKKVVVGQDWDLFSPVTSYTFDYVGLYFQAGNTGFMRQQAQYLESYGDYEWGAALGMAGNNPGVSDANLETAKSPSYAFRLSKKIENGRMGLSSIYARLKYEQPTENGTSHDSYGFNSFYEQTMGSVAIKSEIYVGQNMNNIGTLAIGKGTQNSNVKEIGGTLTGSYKIADQKTIFGGVGLAKVTNPKDMTAFAPNPSTGAAITAPGIKSNFLTRVGFEYKVTEDLSWLSELSRYETLTKLGATSNQLNIAHSVETGVQLRF